MVRRRNLKFWYKAYKKTAYAAIFLRKIGLCPLRQAGQGALWASVSCITVLPTSVQSVTITVGSDGFRFKTWYKDKPWIIQIFVTVFRHVITLQPRIPCVTSSTTARKPPLSKNPNLAKRSMCTQPFLRCALCWSWAVPMWSYVRYENICTNWLIFG